jgi:hypothetical protein
VSRLGPQRNSHILLDIFNRIGRDGASVSAHVGSAKKTVRDLREKSRRDSQPTPRPITRQADATLCGMYSNQVAVCSGLYQCSSRRKSRTNGFRGPTPSLCRGLLRCMWEHDTDKHKTAGYRRSSNIRTSRGKDRSDTANHGANTYSKGGGIRCHPKKPEFKSLLLSLILLPSLTRRETCA